LIGWGYKVSVFNAPQIFDLLNSTICITIAFLQISHYTKNNMKKIIQVHVYKGDTYFIAECVDLPVVTQGKTLDELVENLKEAIALQLEDENPADFDLVEKPSILASFEMEPAYAKA